MVLVDRGIREEINYTSKIMIVYILSRIINK